ncbi:MAG TPA: AbfB domain-containing protein [Rariglobus sp.]|jgi:hypothetical protein|nr:AbfB domain-containing protein [Rariglobus sp.]
MKKIAMVFMTLATVLGAKAAFEIKQAPLMTRWAAQVSTTNVLPEYPRPQMVRPDWLNLNGLWEFSSAKEGDPVPVGKTLSENILVPYPVESPLSGLMRSEERMWYRRTFVVPSDWTEKHVLLHFGAVDWEAAVYINGRPVGGHKGGYGAFDFDITDKLKQGTNEVIVGVYAPVDKGRQPVGKQTLVPRGYWYAASSGIWQTVWLEAVPAVHITRLDMTPDVPASTLRLVVRSSDAGNETVEAVALAGGREVGRATGIAGAEIALPIANARLWSPDDPFLYDIKVSLKKTAGATDAVSGYFAMRSIGIGKVDGIMRPLLNGKFVFMIGPLDQGFWPDGNYTAPTDEALRFDLEQEKACGFNTVRKHIKVEPARWYYWADKLGLLVLQDMPSMAPNGVRPDGTARTSEHPPEVNAEEKKQFEAEFKEMIDQLRSVPSIIGWVEFNEGWGEYRDRSEVARLANWIKSYDPSRLVIAETGYSSVPSGDVLDWHTYPGPASPPPSGTRIAGQGEFGGMGFVVKDHSWTPVNRDQDTSANYTARYVDMIGRIKALMHSPGLSYAIFTQITDVENERNGFFTYDRAVFKGDMKAIRAAHDDLIADSKAMRPVSTVSVSDDFSHAEAWATHSGTWRSDQDGFANIVPGLALTKACFSNVSVTADMTMSAAGEAGLVFRMSGEATARNAEGYFAGLSCSSGLTLSYVTKGEWVPIKSVPLGVVSGKRYRLRVDAFGGTIRVFVDDMSAPLLDVTDYRSLAGSVGFRATDANVRFAHLSVTDPFLRLEPSRIEGFVIHNSRDKNIVHADRNVNRDDDALWKMTPGLADEKGISFESARMPGFYLRDRAGVITFEKDDESGEFKADATWRKVAGLSDKDAFSYESFGHPGEYLREARPLGRKPAVSDRDKADATFAERK